MSRAKLRQSANGASPINLWCENSEMPMAHDHPKAGTACVWRTIFLICQVRQVISEKFNIFTHHHPYKIKLGLTCLTRWLGKLWKWFATHTRHVNMRKMVMCHWHFAVPASWIGGVPLALCHNFCSTTHLQAWLLPHSSSLDKSDNSASQPV